MQGRSWILMEKVIELRKPPGGLDTDKNISETNLWVQID